MLVKLIKGETAFHEIWLSRRCLGDMAACMLEVLYRLWVGVSVPFAIRWS